MNQSIQNKNNQLNNQLRTIELTVNLNVNQHDSHLNVNQAHQHTQNHPTLVSSYRIPEIKIVSGTTYT